MRGTALGRALASSRAARHRRRRGRRADHFKERAIRARRLISLISGVRAYGSGPGGLSSRARCTFDARCAHALGNADEQQRLRIRGCATKPAIRSRPSTSLAGASALIRCAIHDAAVGDGDIDQRLGVLGPPRLSNKRPSVMAA
jgi:hypothetical protein